MAPGRIALGGIAAAAASIVLAVTGCGGGSSSAPGTTGGGSATAPSGATWHVAGEGDANGTATKAEGGSSNKARESDAAAPEKGRDEGKGKSEKKHPTLELPTGKPESGPTKAQQERVPTADIKVAIPDGLTTANTCNGRNVAPAISWQNVPAGTVELAIFAMSVQPVDGKLYFDWALAGVDPTLQGLKPGEVPKGAVLGRNSAGRNGYSLCPAGSGSETYVFSVYALPSSLSPKPGFDPLTLRKQATRASEEVGLTAATLSS